MPTTEVEVQGYELGSDFTTDEHETDSGHTIYATASPKTGDVTLHMDDEYYELNGFDTLMVGTFMLECYEYMEATHQANKMMLLLDKVEDLDEDTKTELMDAVNDLRDQLMEALGEDV